MDEFSNGHQIFKGCDLSNWECELFGCGRSIVLRPQASKVPNRFWRWMQYVCFGNKWRKIK